LSTIASASPSRAPSGPLASGDHSLDEGFLRLPSDPAALTFIGRGTTRGPTFPLSPENRFLATCASPRASSERIRELLELNLDWQLVLDYAIENGIAPLIYFHLKHFAQDYRMPRAILGQLRLCCRESAAIAIHQSAKLREILVALDRRNIPAIVMKGAALSEMLYQAAGLRPMLGIDLMVPSSELTAAARVLAELGYASDESYQEADWYRSHHHHLAPLLSSDRSVIVELHHELASPQANLSIPTNELWKRARAARIACAPALVLAPEDLILGICAHVAISKRFVKSLRDLAEIGAVIQLHRSEINWNQLVRTAHEWRAARCAYYCLWAAQMLTIADVPLDVLNALKRETDLNTAEDACVKFLIPRAIFPDSTRLKPWLINDLVGEILCPQIGLARRLEKRILHYLGFPELVN
jgi:Uncharacterised nucleotidyltransferase